MYGSGTGQEQTGRCRLGGDDRAAGALPDRLGRAAGTFTVNEVNKAGAVVQIGTWGYDATNHTLTGAPFVQIFSPYLAYSGLDSYMSSAKMAVATKGFSVDDLAAWAAAQTTSRSAAPHIQRDHGGRPGQLLLRDSVDARRCRREKPPPLEHHEGDVG